MGSIFYKSLSIGLGITVVILLAVFSMLPKPVNTLALNHDLNDFKTSIALWNTQYGKNASSAEAEAALSENLNIFSQKLRAYQ
ncbi:MAG TPA: hypothetical protein VNG29_00700 [Candidatus Paceibacterota bacterium]|nr:hypothetical protein [Candidatus Paceibacterota bacterium]